ncbi:Maf family protein [Rarobacter incanus]|uniref:Nucleoside triphosphate pyrophosphatase n=1 Tax=Rarobacter incanus TaxID=153494 RepID=A0A542SN76_9MICO|nr:nucleoside triphosphate pyrophosphatase [Rarobacter incanus]TQK76086.1 septum formation protein [Rarobacter incanus]
MVEFILASASPARLALLRAAGIAPIVHVSGVDEDAVLSSLADADPTADAATQVLTLSEHKAADVARFHAGALVVGCDSMLEVGGDVVGKPRTPHVAIRRWRDMRGKTGTLHTGHSIVGPDGATLSRTASTLIRFANPSDDEIAAYVATGEPLGVAGGFTIDGKGGAFIDAIEGDHHNVVGISIPLLRTMTAQIGIKWTQLWAD